MAGARPVRGRAALLAAASALTAASTLAACGAGDGARRAAFTVAIPAASFPARQQVASPAVLRIAVRNDARRRLPDVAVSVDSFSAAAAGLASARRPIWILDREPGAGAAASTWALGSLEPGATRTFLWQVTPVRPGRYTVRFRVAAGLGADARVAGGQPAGGAFAVTVTGAAADARVDPVSGRVLRRRRGGGDPRGGVPRVLSAGGAAG
ncbi:MAG: hypothetical protein QOF77_1501 [Solirubrobacteraceae bacterium]|nr:hypothetical protein [Solirubrobacteraceae bacterium]